MVTSTLVLEQEDGRVEEYIGGYDDWLRQKKETLDSGKSSVKSLESKKRSRSQIFKQVLNPILKQDLERKNSIHGKVELDGLPRQIEAMEKEQADIFEKMASPDFYKTDAAEIARIKARHDELETIA
ncbi:MAG: hypothetical protein R2861_02200 [Desulfobacterales bacterium]